MVRRWFVAAAAAVLASPFSAARAHPIHMSVTEIRFAKNGETADLIVKVFADDFSTAAARFTRSHIDSGKIIDRTRGYAYLDSRVRLANGTTRIQLIPCGVSASGETLLFCLRANVKGQRSSLRLTNSLLTELFGDQVNVVQSVNGKRRSSRMFIRGDGWKSIT